jgi:hypothetical protein
VFAQVRRLINHGLALARNLALIRSVTGFGETLLLFCPQNVPTSPSPRLKRPPPWPACRPSGHASGSSRRGSGIISCIKQRAAMPHADHGRAWARNGPTKAPGGLAGRWPPQASRPRPPFWSSSRRRLVCAHALVRTRTPFCPRPQPVHRSTGSTVSPGTAARRPIPLRQVPPSSALRRTRGRRPLGTGTGTQEPQDPVRHGRRSLGGLPSGPPRTGGNSGASRRRPAPLISWRRRPGPPDVGQRCRSAPASAWRR